MDQGAQNNILLEKLDEFIRRYYKNQLVKGVLYSSGILVASFLLVTSLEYFGEFNTTVRGLLFFGFLFSALGVIVKYIIIPLLKLNKIGQIISYDQAANIIGNHFSHVKDKLLNVLQLQNNQALNGSQDLLVAGINQKINELRPVPFSTAINISENKKYLKYVLPLFFITFLIAIIWPQVISKSTTRLVHYQTYYEKEMPFKFNITNKNLEVLQTRDYKLDVEITGEQVPNEVFVNINGIEYKLEKHNNTNFSYVFAGVQASMAFQLSAAGFLSKEYELKVLPKPSLLQFNLQLSYPSYLNKPSEEIANTGDIQIPQGTKVNWVFNTKNTDRLLMQFSDSSYQPLRRNENQFTFSKRFMHSDNYSLKPLNKHVLSGADSVNYNINVIPDQYPNITVSEKADSLDNKSIYFSGQIKDDYGFTSLTFHYKKFVTDTNGVSSETAESFPVSFSKANTTQPYFYYLNISQFNLSAGDKVEYYFEVFDNDGVNGAKSSKTQLFTFKAPTLDEINKNTERNNTEIKKDLEESIKKAQQLQKDVNELAKKVNDKTQLGYEEKKKLEDVLKKQQELQNKINEIKQENQQNNKQQNEFSQTDESIMEKQKQLEELFDKVMTPEMKKLYDELNKMLEKLDKNQVQEKLEELKLNNKDIEKELDRNLELFKQLEVQQKMQNAIDKLDELKKKEDELNKETEGRKPENKEENKSDKKEDDKNQQSNNKEENKTDKKEDNKNQQGDKKEENKPDTKKPDDKSDKRTDAKELEKKQEEISKEFEELKKELKDLEEKNKQLEEPMKMPNNEQKKNDVSDHMQKSSNSLSKNNKKEASKAQKEASEKMEEMKEEMEEAMKEEEEKQNEENAQAMRQILENLLNLSFGQEEVIKALEKTRIDNPQYVDIPKLQNKLKEDSKLIEDSLLALSKREPQVSAYVNREINAIHDNMNKTVKALAERNVGESKMRAQSSMSSVNKLALLLNESLDQKQNQMKQQMKSKSKKSGKCKKPGTGSGKNPSQGNSSTNMRKLQEQLNKQLQDMKEAMNKGQKPGDKSGDKKGQKPGDKQGNGLPGYQPGSSSEQFAKMAAQQEAIRRQMQALMDKLKNKGKNPGGDLANLMEETEKDLVNKRLSNETMMRQQEILSRLLESEKAEREREQDEQRKSNEAKNQELSNPAQFLEYKRLKEKEMELLNTVPPGLTPYYKDRVNNYFNRMIK